MREKQCGKDFAPLDRVRQAGFDQGGWRSGLRTAKFAAMRQRVACKLKRASKDLSRASCATFARSMLSRKRGAA